MKEAKKKTAKPVIATNISTGEVLEFPYQTEASRHFNVNESTIRKAITRNSLFNKSFKLKLK